LRDKEPYLNRGEDDVKGPHEEGSKSTIDREASGANRGRNGPGRSAQAGRLWGPRFSSGVIKPKERVYCVDFGQMTVNLGHHLENITDKP
jgi:hypothetical protein